ncbi:hypothetical protein [Nocardia xishanensis]|uniref:hypothetical protein n=1 Tax=Nocardia xishanensis TaxID=238964 RepID=UPI00082E750D|nr:hypothetical protein [Nocardia xishanensis]
MHAFDPNDYRKRVLAAVERRGGIEQSDPFELYDIPLDEAETLGDAEVSARVAEVWGFWQRQRDHPKYRVLVGLLVENHDRLSFLLLDASARRAEAIRIRREREQRDAERYEMLDTAISRLVQRHGGVPAAKVPGLEEIGAMGGLNAAEVAARLRRHRIIEDEQPQAAPAATGALTDQRRGQIRALLAEWGRLVEDPPPPTLLGLLGLDPSRATHTGEIRLRADALRARARELPPGRMRVVLDELLVHVQDLLEPGGPVVAEYLASIVEDVTAELRPKVRAAVLVEDELVGEDYEFLFDEAIALGMDPHAAGRLLEDLAVELGSRAVGSARHAPPVRTPASSAPSPAPPRRLWEDPLKAARAALRNGRPQEAARHIAEARGLDPHNEGTTPIRSVSDDVERVLAEAALHWRVALAARAATRYVEALEHLRELRRAAADVPPPTGHTAEIDELLAEAERAVAEADRLVAAAAAGPAADRSRTLRAAQAACVDHPGASEALAATPIPAPGRVTATRMANGSVRVVWAPASADDVNYRVTRLQPDGSWRVVGRTRGTELEDGGAPPGETPVYAVAAAISGSYSDTVRSDAPPEPRADRSAPPGAPGPSGSMAQTAAVGANGSTVEQGATTEPGMAGRASDERGASEPGVFGAGGSIDRGACGGHGAVGAAGSTIEHGTVAQPGSGFPHGQATEPNPAVQQTSGSATEPSGVARPDPAATGPEQTTPQAATSAVTQDDPMPSGIPVVTDLAERAGLLTFVWPRGITEVMVVARTDGPPAAPDEPEARAWKVTNMRYEIDGGVRVPPDLPRPCHIAVASCRREPNGKLTVAAGFAPDARIHWTHA